MHLVPLAAQFLTRHLLRVGPLASNSRLDGLSLREECSDRADHEARTTALELQKQNIFTSDVVTDRTCLAHQIRVPEMGHENDE